MRNRFTARAERAELGYGRFGLAVAGMLAVIVALTLTLAGRAGASRGTANASLVVGVAKTKLGRFLVAGGRTVYLFEKDKKNRSACSGTCSKFWPPVISSGKPVAGRGVKAALLGVAMRTNGAHQVVYAGHPLYWFLQDTRSGQTKGQGLTAFGAGWYVVSPSGVKIDHG